MKDYLLGSVVAFLSFFLGLGICYWKTENLNNTDKKHAEIFHLLLEQVKQKNIKKKYDAARCLFHLRKQFLFSHEKIIPILLQQDDVLVKTLLLDTIAHSPYYGKKLLIFLDDPHEDVRAAAIGVAKTQKSSRCKIVNMAQNDTSSFVRKSALQCLFKWKLSPKKYVAILKKSLKDEEDEVRIVAAHLLGKIHLTGTIKNKVCDILMQHIIQEPGEARYTAMESLGRFPHKHVIQFVCTFLKFSDMRPSCIKALAKMSILSIDTLEILHNYAIMYDSTANQILDVVLSSESNARNLLPFLVKYNEKEDIDTKVIKAFHLHREKGVTLLLQMIQTEKWEIKKRALHILGKLKVKSDLVDQVLLDQLKKQDTMKYEFIVALGTWPK